MHYFYKNFITNHDQSLFVFFDCYNKKLTIKEEKSIIIEKQYSKLFFKDFLEFSCFGNSYKLQINSFQFPLFKKFKIMLYENGILLPVNKIENKNWNLSTKNRKYHVNCKFHSFNSSMLIKINDEVLYNSMEKEKFFEANIRKINYDNQVFTFKKTKIDDEIFTITLKLNSRDDVFCQEDNEFKKTLAIFKRDIRDIKLKYYLKFKLLPIFIFPILLTALLLLQIYAIDNIKIEVTSFILFIIFGYISFVLTFVLGYVVGYKLFKKRFR